MRRILSFTLVRLVVLFVLVAGMAVLSQLATALVALHVAEEARTAALVAGWLIGAPLILVVYRLAVRLIERRRPAELAALGGLRFVLMGVAFGAMLIATTYVVLWSVSVAHYDGLGSLAGVPLVFAISVGSAVGEELIFRGVLFRIVEEGFGTLVALAVSAALFGGLHAWNPGASLVSSVAIALEAGILLGLAYAGTRSLWLPIGIHFGWNFTEGGVFGGAISGVAVPGMVQVPLAGPPLLTGGDFGPEASVVTLAVCLTASVILLLATARHGQWRRLRAVLRHPGGPPGRPVW